ncbi:MAG TPA: prolyl oligopeptidase family serine peptidase [Terriglobales bacterium]|nr:prolyl oligopeptidase family serine peptidase [Terriglobales bacterium]
MNTSTYRQSRAVVCALVLLLVTSFALAQSAPAKRPITHRDYDNWKNIQNQKLSPDGKFVVYALFPQEGDGEAVIRNLATGVEYRESIGAKPAPPPSNPLSEITGQIDRPQPIGITVSFTADSKRVVFSTFPLKADTDKAKRAKKKPEEMPKGDMVIVELESGKATRVARVKSFQVSEKSNEFIAYLKEREPEKKVKGEAKTDSATEEAKAEEHRKEEEKSGDKDKKKEYGSELVLKNLTNGAERSLTDVVDYVLSKDGATLVYAVSSKKEDANGAYVVATANANEAPRTLASGKGKYVKLTFDEKQTQLAFLTDRDDQTSKPPRFALYRWDMKSAAAGPVVSRSDEGLQKDFAINEKGALSFSRDGKRLFFGVALYQPEKPKDDQLEDEKVSADLWSWRDDNVQPMQKARADAEKSRSYRAVYHLEAKKTVQLGDGNLPDVTPSEDGLWAIGVDNREYRPMIEYGIRVSDSYLINAVTGERKCIGRKQYGRLQWSPDSKYIVHYDGKHWISTAVPSLAQVNLTAKLGVSFADEEDDHPDIPSSYGFGGWTKDGRFALLYDRYDIWQVSPDGKSAKNLTGIGRKNKIQFRYLRVNSDSKDPDDRWIDAAKPMLLSAEDEDTRDSGFYRTKIDASEPPQKLIMKAAAFTDPVKAKDADVLMLTESRFDQFPDLQVADPDFRTFKKVTDANPQKAQLLWGTAELLSYRSIDGVPLKATLYKPASFDPNKKYPMLVYIYEKLSDGVHQFVDPRPGQNINPSYYTSNGYLVLQPDIVYEIGHPGQSALKCVLAAIDDVVEKGFVDEKAIGIQGHSWGGYQISYMITQTNRFRAVAAGAPVSNMTSAYGGIRWGSGLPRQFQYEKTQSRIGGSLWEYPMRYIENSPVFMADRVRTPILILHNDADDMVPWYQGIEYFLALRRLGKEAYMFSYNGEPHGIRRRANQKDYTVRLQQYFDYFLKGAPMPEWMDKGIPFLAKDEEKLRFNAEAYGLKPVSEGRNAEATTEKPAGEKSSAESTAGKAQ